MLSFLGETLTPFNFTYEEPVSEKVINHARGYLEPSAGFDAPLIEPISEVIDVMYSRGIKLKQFDYDWSNNRVGSNYSPRIARSI